MPENSSSSTEQINDMITRALRTANGDAQTVATTLGDRLREVQRDNARLRRQKREYKTQIEALEKAAKLPEGHTAVKTDAWDAAQKAVAALAKVGVTADALPDAFTRGQDALTGLASAEAARAQSLSDAGAKAFARLVKDHKLTVVVKTTKGADNKDVTNAFIVGADGQETAAKAYVEQHYGEFAPAIYAPAPSGTGAPASRTNAEERRMPAGPIGSRTSAPSAGDAPSTGRRRYADSYLDSRYPKPADAAGRAGATPGA